MSSAGWKKWLWLLPAAQMGAITVASSAQGTPHSDELLLGGLSVSIAPNVQNLLHIPAFAVVGFSWRWALDAWIQFSAKANMLAIAVTGAFGVVDEIHQYFVPYRYASLDDMLFNLIGACVGTAVFAVGGRR